MNPLEGVVSSATTTNRWLNSGLVTTLLLALGCTTTPPARPDLTSYRLEDEIVGGEEPLSSQDDYWTETLDAYVRAEELHTYWLLAPEERFAVFGRKWLDACLREDLLKKHRWALSPEEVARISTAPDYQTSEKILKSILGKRSERQ